MTYICHMYANLVRPARKQTYLTQRAVGVLLDYLIIGYCRLAVGTNATLDISFCHSLYRGVNSAFLRLGGALYHGVIFLVPHPLLHRGGKS